MSFKDEALEVAAMAAAAPILAVPVILAWQFYLWLKTGVWQKIQVIDAMRYFDIPLPVTSWLGVQTIIDRILSMECWFALFLSVSGLYLAVMWASIYSER